MTKYDLRFFSENEYTTVIAGENLADKDYCFIAQPNMSGYTAGRAYKCDGSNEALSVKNPLKGFNVSGAVTSGSSLNLQITGNVPLSGLNLGQYYFISTSGTLTNNSSGDYRFLVGICNISGYLSILKTTDMSNVDMTKYYMSTNKAYFAGGTYNGSSATVGMEKISADNIIYTVRAGFAHTYTMLTQSATISSTAYIAGGQQYWQNSAGSNVISKFNSNETGSVISATLSNVRNVGMGASISSSVYFIGGNSYQGSDPIHYNRIDKLNSETSCTAISATLSSTRFSMSGGTISSSVYIASGGVWYLNGSFTPTVAIDKLTSDSSCGAISATLSMTHANGAGGSMSSAVYIIGGYTTDYVNNPGYKSNKVEKIVSDTSSSRVAATLGVARSSSTGAVATYIYIAGGATSNSENETTVYKLISDVTCSSISATLSSTRTGCVGISMY
jgi:hypothetical protein